MPACLRYCSEEDVCLYAVQDTNTGRCVLYNLRQTSQKLQYGQRAATWTSRTFKTINGTYIVSSQSFSFSVITFLYKKL